MTVQRMRLGQCARLYVAGGMDPYLTPSCRDSAVRWLSRRGLHDEAAALLAGWVTHRDEGPAGPTAWHRLLGDVRVEVGAA